MKVKKWLLGLVTFAAMVVICAVCAGAETFGDYEYSVLNDGTVEITGYSGSAEKVDIPEKIDGKSVTSIGNYAFSGNSSFTNVTIPNGVTNIGIGAFDNCRKLISISIPNCVTSIGDYAFSSCYGLTRITIPESVKIISEFVFSDCRNLTNIRIPGSVTSICKGAFRGCTSLTSITIPNGVTSIGGSAFDGCTSLTSITIPNSVTRILGDTFGDCTNLTSVTLPESLTYIGSAFGGCTSLTSITIPNSVTYVDVYAFAGCTNLTEIKVAVENPNYVSVNGVLYNKSRTVLICYPAGKKDKNYKIPDSVTEIGRYAFKDCTSLTSITIPNGVTSIGESAFGGCTSLTSITIPNSVTNIDASAFRDCTSLTSITIPNSVTEIGWWAFDGCTSLTSITIPNSVTSIGKKAFGYYYDEYDDSVKKIDNFKIYCYSGTAGEKYAKDNGFTYELLDQPTISNVTGFKIKSIFSTNVTLQWDKNANASGYEIEQYKGGKWTQIAKINNSSTVSYNVSGLAADTTYTFRMRAYKTLSSGTSYSDYVRLAAKTQLTNTDKFVGTAISPTAVKLDWNRNDKVTGYIIEQYKGGKWTQIAVTKNNTTLTFTVKGLADATPYSFRIKTYKNADGKTNYSGYTTVKAETPPAAVKNVRVTSTTATWITLEWERNANVTGYAIEQYKGGKWTQIAVTKNNTTLKFIVKGLNPDTKYSFRIRAYKTNGTKTTYGGYVSMAGTTRIANVAKFNATALSQVAVKLSWSRNTIASGYVIEQYKGGKWTQINVIKDKNVTTMVVAPLAKGTTYSFRMKSFKTVDGSNRFSEYISAKATTAK